VAFFQRILNFTQKDTAAPTDKRRAVRYAVSEKFPLKAGATLLSRDGVGHLLPDGKTQDWVGRLINLSTTGVSLQLHPAALAAPGEPCTFIATLHNQQLRIAGTVAHFRPHRLHSACGIALAFPDFETHKTYLQLMQPVLLGASLKPVDATRVEQDTAGFQKEQYRGDADGVLTVWRKTERNEISGFEFRLPPYAVAGTTQDPKLDVYVPEEAWQATAASDGASCDEVRQLFHWAVPNLARAVPADVRNFMEKF